MLKQNAYHIIMFYDSHDKWNYRDDHHRVVKFNEQNEAEKKVEQILKQDNSIVAADVILVDESVITHVEKYCYVSQKR